MKKLKGSLAAKIVAVLLLTVFMVSFVGSALGCGVLYSLGGYEHSREEAREKLLESIAYSAAMDAGWDYLAGRDPAVICADMDFRFEVFNRNGKNKIFSNYNGEPLLWCSDKLIFYSPYPARDEMNIQQFPVTATPTPSVGSAVPIPVPTGQIITEPVAESEDNYYHVKAYFLLEDSNPYDEISLKLNAFDYAYANRYGLIALAAVSLLLGIITLIFLLSAAGHRAGCGGITPNFMDRIPYDIFCLLLISCIATAIVLGAECFMWESIPGFALGAVLFLIGGELGLAFVMSTATRIKLKNILKNTVCWKVLSWIWRFIKKAALFLFRVIRNVPFVRRGLLIYALFMAAELFFMAVCGAEAELVLFWFVGRMVLGAALVYALLCLKKLREGAHEIASGNEKHRIDTYRMYGGFREHADDLNNIGEGIIKAVDERMKSERFKTELITNVSHDIKTPLTSIVNYVDLLAKEEPENEKMREYIGVLSRQSAKLKKLTEDLVEASKASSGSLPVNFEKCALNVLLDQTAGEYAGRLYEKNLELVLNKPETDMNILADGRHIWRVFDNLMNNICKYAQSGTRVYLSLERKGERAEVTFKNISRNQLNISGDELMERFVRGDSSRNTEGSGLGLSIARSLVELQKGSMELSVDGDLFKVILSFPIAE